MKDLCGRLKDKRIVVVGDAIADQFLEGSISRVSREAPVFILRHESTVTVPGGAANAAANVAALGGNVSLIGTVGDDHNAELLRDALQAVGVDVSGIISISSHTTTTKVRVLAGHQHAVRQQVIRIDHESDHPIPQNAYNELVSRLETAAHLADAILVSDYGYGVIAPEVFQTAREIADQRGIPLVVDSRRRLAEFKGATSATPNQEEVGQVLGSDFTHEQCEELRETLGLTALLVTNGNQGIALYRAGVPPVLIPAVGPMEPVDVTGAGDAVIATYTMALAAGASFREAAELANYAGGIAVMKKGTATVSALDLMRALGDQARDAVGQANS